jgi:N-acyl-D-aspartate/D-glutamate deacylase
VVPVHDLIIRGARVADGLGTPLRTMDVAVDGERIAALGRVPEPARQTIAADGLVLAPGIVDVHTHYDAQLTWDPTASPSPALGVTTVVMGNCGFSLAPCPPASRDLVARNLAEVEGMELNALRAGIAWSFESFADYLAALRRQGSYPNVAAFVGHSTLRTAVMGEAGSQRAATEAEIAAMRRLVLEALGAGAIGLASTTNESHYGWGGVPMPSRLATDAEFRVLIGALKDAGRGLFQMTVGPRTTVAFLESLALETGRPMVFAALNHNALYPERCTDILREIEAARGRGAEVWAQTNCQPLSMDFPLNSAYCMYSLKSWAPLREASGKETFRQAFADPAFRQRYIAELSERGRGRLFNGEWNKIEVAFAARPENRGLEGRPLDEIARERGCHPAEAMFDIALGEDLATVFNAKLLNSEEDAVEPLIRHECGVISLSDGGAHLRYMCDAAFGLHLLGRWVRERGTFSLEDAIRRLTGVPARAYRLIDRGVLREGAFADLLLFDPATVGRGPLRRVYDLPGGESRFIRDPLGVHGVWVNGRQVFDGKAYVAQATPPGHVLDRFSA